MWNLYDIVYWIGIVVAAPVWAAVPKWRGKVMSAFAQRVGDVQPRSGDGPRILIHAVSLGEMNATRALIDALRQERPELEFVVSATTKTGYERGVELYGPMPDVSVVRYPLDFSKHVSRFLDNVKPNMVVLMELEVWPNFVKRCEERSIPVMLANARVTPSSFRHYRWADLFLRPTFQRLTLVYAQDVIHGERFVTLGVPPTHVVVAGTMKFDNASPVPPASAWHRARQMQLSLDEEIIWICGSTGPGEEEIILRIFRRLLARFARLRLVIVPRHPERFDEVAQLIEDHKFQCLRTGGVGRERVDFFAVIPPVVLVDQMGVLREYYAIANVVFVGRSLVDLGHRQHGSDMIEPAALVKPVIVGPYTANFAEAVRKFRQADAMMVVDDEEGLEQAVGVLLSTPKEASAMALRASEVVKRERGATARHASAILQVLAAKRGEEISTRPVNPIVTHARPVHPEGTVAPPTPPPPMQTERMPLPALDQPAPPIKKSTSVVITRLGPVPPAPPGESR